MVYALIRLTNCRTNRSGSDHLLKSGRGVSLFLNMMGSLSRLCSLSRVGQICQWRNCFSVTSTDWCTARSWLRNTTLPQCSRVPFSTNTEGPPPPPADSGSQTHSHLPFWTPGTGHYGHTLGQLTNKVALSCTDLFHAILDTVPVKREGVFTIGDYGANDGSGSMELMTVVIDFLRKKHGEQLPIQIIYEDQHGNDFNSLFKNLDDSSSYMSKYSNVYPFASSLNFYKQCVPDSTCDIIFVHLASHWLQKLDLNFKDCVFHFFATKEECDALRQQADHDWVQFLVLRAKELKPGGHMIMQSLSSYPPEHGQPVVAQIDYKMDLQTAWTDMKNEGIITQEEHKSCTFKFKFRTAEESRLPFDTEGSPVLRSHLRLMHIEEFVLPCPLKARWRENRQKGMDAAENKNLFAESLVTVHRVWSQSTFHGSLSDTRSASEKAAIMDELYRRFQALVLRKDPETYRSDVSLLRLVIRKDV